jgi:CheY-like chemotaxis protein
VKILIVDDVEANRKLITFMLKGAGYAELLSADSAKTAFELLGIDAEGQEMLGDKEASVDLILMDIAMPGLDGIEASRRIKAIDRLKDIPIIIISAMNEKELLGVAFDAGAMDYISKPVNDVELLARIRSALRLKEELARHKAHYKELAEVKKRLKEAEEKLKEVDRQNV